MKNKLHGIKEKYIKLEHLLSDPAVIADQVKYQKCLKEHGELNKIVAVINTYEETVHQLAEAMELVKDSDPDIRDMAKEEVSFLGKRQEELELELKLLLMPKDPRDEKNVILEIRAGTGGEEAGLFAGDLFRMYSRYAESKGWTMEMIDKSVSSSGGFKEVVSMVKGNGAFSSFKFESGTHRRFQT